MALVLLGTAAALGVHASRKRSRALADLQDPASDYLPEAVQDKKLYDPLRRGPRWATDWLANRALHFRTRWPQPFRRPLHDNGQYSVLIRSEVGPETAVRMQHMYAEALPEGPPFFNRKTVSLNRQIQPYQMPAYHADMVLSLSPKITPLVLHFNRPHCCRRQPQGVQQISYAVRFTRSLEGLAHLPSYNYPSHAVA